MFMLAQRMYVDHGWRLVRKENENERKEKARERVKINTDWISEHILAVAIQAEKTIA